jgi:hypothetical protein
LAVVTVVQFASTPSLSNHSDATNFGSITVKPGSATGPGGKQTNSSIELTRTIKLNNDKESIQVTSFYDTILQHASLKVKIWFVPVAKGHGASMRTALNFSHSAGAKPKEFIGVDKKTGLPQSDTVKKLRSGTTGEYVIHVKISYQVNGSKHTTGAWTNVSPHTITFLGGL